MKLRHTAWAAAWFLVLGGAAARADNAPGVTAHEIKLGQTATYSGVAAQTSAPIAQAEQAYFRMINEHGGIDGRAIVLDSVDDAFDPAKALAQTKKLVEQDHVAAIFGAFGTAQNLATEPYLNAAGIPDLFVITGDDVVINRKKFPWTTGGVPVFRVEAQIFGRYILVNLPAAKVAILHSRDEMGASYVTGLRQGMGAKFATQMVREVDVADTATNIDAAWTTLKASGADTLIVAASPQTVAVAIAKAHDGDWHPQLLIDFAASSPSVLAVAGFDKAKGIITANSYLDTGLPQWADSPAAKPFNDFVAKYLSTRSRNVGYYLAGYVAAQAMVQVLRQCGDDLSRRNILAQATNLRDFHPVGLIPGITFFTSRTKYLPIVEAALTRFDGQHWVQVGEVMAGF